jgi:hypothetical protein
VRNEDNLRAEKMSSGLSSLLVVGSDGITIPVAVVVVHRRARSRGTLAAGGVGRGGPAGPVISVGERVEIIKVFEHAISDVLGLANLNVVVVPAELLVGLWARKELGS